MRQGRAPRQHLRILHAGGQQVGGRHDAVDQADAVGMLGIDPLAGQDDLHRMTEPHDLRQSDQAAVAGVEAPLRVLQGELGVRRAEAQVAGEREFKPAGNRVAVDRRQNRLVDVEVAGDAAEAGAVGEVLAKFRRGGLREIHRVGLEIGAGAKGLRAGTGDHRDPCLVVGVEVAPDRHQFIIGGEVQRIHPLRAVDGDQSDVLMAGIENVGHGLPGK